MKILPSASNFKKWAAIPPTDGDLLFFKERDVPLVRNLEFPLYTSDEVRSQSLSLWSLHQRSWYLYALGRASHCLWLPAGVLESLDREFIKKLSAVQRRLEIPTFLPTSRLNPSARARCLNLGRYHWVTSQAWFFSTHAQKSELFRVWFEHNKIEKYGSVEFEALPEAARHELKRVGFDSLLNTYLDSSGPNCFGAVAGALSGVGKTAARQWLHWKPLERFLASQHYQPVEIEHQTAADVLLFELKGEIVHAAYCIGGGYYFEMPGQDFYEPYRVEKFDNWRRAWPGTNLTILRKKRD